MSKTTYLIAMKISQKIETVAVRQQRAADRIRYSVSKLDKGCGIFIK